MDKQDLDRINEAKLKLNNIYLQAYAQLKESTKDINSEKIDLIVSGAVKVLEKRNGNDI